LLVILLVLIALVARVDAAPAGDPIDLAIRYADARSGAQLGAVHPAVLDDDGDEADEDRAAERAAMDDREDEDRAVREAPAGRELAARTGEVAEVEKSLLGGRGEAGGPAGLALDDGDAGESVDLALGGDHAGARAGLALDDDDAGSRASLALERDAAGRPMSLALDDAAGESASLALGEDDAIEAWSAGPGALALLDAELAPGDATAGLDAADAAATAGAGEVYEQSMRHQRPSPWGRLDVGVSWRRRWSAPIHAPAHRHDEVWLVATWRR
jgi:hypothetical protein